MPIQLSDAMFHTPTELISTTNIDTVTTPGNYEFTTLTNSPVAGAGHIYVVVLSNNIIQQTLTEEATLSTYTRHYNGTWSEWIYNQHVLPGNTSTHLELISVDTATNYTIPIPNTNTHSVCDMLVTAYNTKKQSNAVVGRFYYVSNTWYYDTVFNGTTKDGTYTSQPVFSVTGDVPTLNHSSSTTENFSVHVQYAFKPAGSAHSGLPFAIYSKMLVETMKADIRSDTNIVVSKSTGITYSAGKPIAPVVMGHSVSTRDDTLLDLSAMYVNKIHTNGTVATSLNTEGTLFDSGYALHLKDDKCPISTDVLYTNGRVYFISDYIPVAPSETLSFEYWQKRLTLVAAKSTWIGVTEYDENDIVVSTEKWVVYNWNQQPLNMWQRKFEHYKLSSSAAKIKVSLYVNEVNPDIPTGSSSQFHIAPLVVKRNVGSLNTKPDINSYRYLDAELITTPNPYILDYYHSSVFEYNGMLYQQGYNGSVEGGTSTLSTLSTLYTPQITLNVPKSAISAPNSISRAFCYDEITDTLYVIHSHKAAGLNYLYAYEGKCISSESYSNWTDENVYLKYKVQLQGDTTREPYDMKIHPHTRELWVSYVYGSVHGGFRVFNPANGAILKDYGTYSIGHSTISSPITDVVISQLRCFCFDKLGNMWIGAVLSDSAYSTCFFLFDTSQLENVVSSEAYTFNKPEYFVAMKTTQGTTKAEAVLYKDGKIIAIRGNSMVTFDTGGQ